MRTPSPAIIFALLWGHSVDEAPSGVRWQNTIIGS